MIFIQEAHQKVFYLPYYNIDNKHERRARSVGVRYLRSSPSRDRIETAPIRARCRCCGGVAFQQLPAKLNPIIQPLMAATRRERDEELQSEAARAIAKLVKRAMSREKSPSGKICSNIFTMACSCPETTPTVTESGEKKVVVQTSKATMTTKASSSSKKSASIDDATAAADVIDTEIPETAIAARGGAKALREFCRVSRRGCLQSYRL